MLPREAQQSMLDGLQALEGDFVDKGPSSLIQPQAARQVESAGSGEQACQNSLQPAASSIKSAAGTQPHAPADAAGNPPAGAAHLIPEGQAAAGPAVGAAAVPAAAPSFCNPLPVRGQLMMGHGLLPREHRCYQAAIEAYIQQELWLPLEKRSPALGGKRRLGKPPPEVPLRDILDILVAKDAKKRVREWRTACRASAARALGYELDQLVDVPTLLRNLPADPPMADGLQPFVVPASDSRAKLRGAKGLKTTRSLPAGTFLGVYRGTAYFKAAYDKMLNAFTGGSRYRRKRDFESYGADFSLKEVAGVTKDSRLSQLPDLKWAKECAPNFIPSTDGMLVISALEGMNELALVNDPNIAPASHQGYDEHAGNSQLLPLLIGPVPFLAMFTTKPVASDSVVPNHNGGFDKLVQPGQEVTYCYGEGYWDALTARQADAEHEAAQERELARLMALARQQEQQGQRGGDVSYESAGRSVSVEMPTTAGATAMQQPSLPQQQPQLAQQQLELLRQQQQQQQQGKPAFSYAARLQPKQQQVPPSALPGRPRQGQQGQAGPTAALQLASQHLPNVPFAPSTVAVPSGRAAQGPASPSAAAAAAAAAHHTTVPPPAVPHSSAACGTAVHTAATPPPSLPCPGSTLTSGGASGGSSAKRSRKLSRRTADLVAKMKLSSGGLKQQQQQQDQEGATGGLEVGSTPRSTAATAAAAAAAATARQLDFGGAGLAVDDTGALARAAAADAGMTAVTEAAAVARVVDSAAHQPTLVRPTPKAGGPKPPQPAVRAGHAAPLPPPALPKALSPKAAAGLGGRAAELRPPLFLQTATAAALAKPKPRGGRGGGKGGSTGKLAAASPSPRKPPPPLPANQRSLLNLWFPSPAKKPTGCSGPAERAQQAQPAAGVESPVARRPQPGQQLPFLAGSKAATAAGAITPPAAAGAAPAVAPPALPAAAGAAPTAGDAATAAALGAGTARSPSSKRKASGKRTGREVAHLRDRGDGSLERLQGIVVAEGRNPSGLRWVRVQVEEMAGPLVLAQDQHHKRSPDELQAAQDWAFLRCPAPAPVPHASAPAAPAVAPVTNEPQPSSPPLAAQQARQQQQPQQPRQPVPEQDAAPQPAFPSFEPKAHVPSPPEGQQGNPSSSPPSAGVPGSAGTASPPLHTAAGAAQALAQAARGKQARKGKTPGRLRSMTPIQEGPPILGKGAGGKKATDDIAADDIAAAPATLAGLAGASAAPPLEDLAAGAAADAGAAVSITAPEQRLKGGEARSPLEPGQQRPLQAPYHPEQEEQLQGAAQQQVVKREPPQGQDQQQALKRAKLQPGQPLSRSQEQQWQEPLEAQLQGQRGDGKETVKKPAQQQQQPHGSTVQAMEGRGKSGQRKEGKMEKRKRLGQDGSSLPPQAQQGSAAAAPSGVTPLKGGGEGPSQQPAAPAAALAGGPAGTAGPPLPSDQPQEGGIIDLTWIPRPPAAAVPPCSDGDIIDLTLDDD